MKRFIALMLALISIFTFSVSAFAIEGGTLEPKIGGSGIGYKEEVVSEVLQEHWADMGWHPEVDAPDYGLSGWSFSNSKKNFTISLGVNWNFASVSVSINCSPTQVGKDYECIYREWSRPKVYADIYLQTYKAGMYNFNTNTWASYTIKTRYVTDNSIIRIIESSNRDDLI